MSVRYSQRTVLCPFLNRCRPRLHSFIDYRLCTASENTFCLMLFFFLRFSFKLVRNVMMNVEGGRISV